MGFKQVVEEGQDRPLAELGVPSRTLNMLAQMGAYERRGAPRVPMLSHAVGKDVWDKQNYEDRPPKLGETGLKQLMQLLNEAGYALGSPNLNHELSVLPVHATWKFMLRRGGMTYLDHVTTKSRRQIEMILAGYGFTPDAIKDCLDEVEMLLHGVGLDFAEKN